MIDLYTRNWQGCGSRETAITVMERSNVYCEQPGWRYDLMAAGRGDNGVAGLDSWR